MQVQNAGESKIDQNQTLNSKSVITQTDSPTNQRATNSKKNDIGPPVEMIFKVEERLC